jgi:hypothetical protein
MVYDIDKIFGIVRCGDREMRISRTGLRVDTYLVHSTGSFFL